MSPHFGPLITTSGLLLFVTDAIDKFDPTALWALVITTCLGFVGTVLQNYHANKKASMQRQWDLEDRAFKAEQDRLDRAAKAEELAKKAEEVAEKLRQENLQLFAQLRNETAKNSTQIKQAIQENTELTVKTLNGGVVIGKLDEKGEKI